MPLHDGDLDYILIKVDQCFAIALRQANPQMLCDDLAGMTPITELSFAGAAMKLEAETGRIETLFRPTGATVFRPLNSLSVTMRPAETTVCA